MFKSLVSFFLAAAVAAMAQNGVQGTIRGKVIDERNQPAAGAKIAITPSGVPVFGAVHFEQSDENGLFLFTNVKPGTYVISASLEEQNYPNTLFTLYNDVPIRATLIAEQPSAEVTLSLGAKAAVMTGQVLDAVTGEPIRTAGYRIWQTANVRALMGRSTPTTYTALIPAAKQVKLLFQAPGYEDWYYPGVARESDATPITLKSGDTLNVDVRMTPSVVPNNKAP